MLQALPVIDVRKSSVGNMAAVANLLRGIGIRQIRLASGFVMFSYIFSHFFNHALGNISYSLMETWLGYHIWWWRIPVVNATLYAAAATHFSLGLWALYQRRHFRYTTAEITQLALGLSIPLLIALHLAGVRVNGLLFGLRRSGLTLPCAHARLREKSLKNFPWKCSNASYRKVSMALPVADVVQRGWRSNPNIPLGPNVITAKANRSHSA